MVRRRLFGAEIVIVIADGRTLGGETPLTLRPAMEYIKALFVNALRCTFPFIGKTELAYFSDISQNFTPLNPSPQEQNKKIVKGTKRQTNL